MAALRNARATSAGGVIHRSVDGQIQVVLCHRREPSLWALPKGTPHAGETLEETALRETREETGLEVILEAPIRSVSYVFVRGRTRFHKTVHFYLMRAVGGDVSQHDREFDEVRWVELNEALELMTHATERALVEEAAEMIAARSGAATRPAVREGTR
ncbi:MAG TPA: NUDIX hydrolase [Candidatus Dormibacteraeota bacterium]|nr:NUDIX hydrolase [Candidatus Dormibacteraeota bacterium]